MTETAPSAVADRYGTKRNSRFDRRFGWIAGSIAVLIGIAVLAFGDWYDQTTSFQNTGFTIADETAAGQNLATARFTVTADPGDRVACAVEAMNTSKATVGWKIIDVPATEKLTQKIETEVVTIGRATTVSAKSCWTVAG